MKKLVAKKKGSSMMMVLVISVTLIFVMGTLLVSLYKASKYNNRYNTKSDLQLASKSGLNIGRAELIKEIKKVKNFDELQEKYTFDNEVKEVMNDDKYTYSVTATLSEDKKMYSLISVFTDKDGISNRKTQNIYLNNKTIYDIASLVSKKKVFAILGDDAPSITIATTYGINNSIVSNDIWYVESLKTDLNDKSIINMDNANNIYEFVNGYYKGDNKIEIKDIKETDVGIWKSPLNMLIDDAHQSLEVYSQDGSGNIIGYRKKIDGSKVVLINGNIDITTGSYQFKDTVLYATGDINLKTDDLRLNNTIIIAGKNLNIEARSINISSKPDYYNIDEIQEFIRKYIYE